MSDPRIPGLRRKPVQVHVRKDFVRQEWFLVVNLAELTEEVVRGELVGGGGTTKATWSYNEVGALFYGAVRWNVLDVDQQSTLLRKLIDYLEQFDQNKAPLEHAQTDEGFGSHYDLPGKGTRPTLLWLPEAASFAGLALKARYFELAAARTYEIFYPETNFHVALSSFRSAWIKPVVEANEKLNEQLAPLREGVERLEFLHQVVSAMLDFAAPPAERKRLWNITKPYVDSPHAYVKDFACDPNPTEISNAKSLRDVTLPGLIRTVSAALEWRLAGIASPGHPGTADLILADERNKRAMELLEALRTNKIILLLLKEHENVDPVLWGQLEEVLVEAFAQMCTSPVALEELAASEFPAIARAAVKGDFDTTQCKPKGQRAKAILTEIETFVPDTEFSAQLNDFSENLAKIGDTGDAFTETGALFQRLWVMATPRLLPIFKSAVRSRAYVLRAVVQYVNRHIPEEAEANARSLQKLLDFAHREDPKQLNRFLTDLIDRTKKARLVGAAGLAGVKLLASGSALGLALGDLGSGDVTEKKTSAGLAVATKLVATTKNAGDFLGATLEAAPYLQGRMRAAHGVYEALTTVAGKAGKAGKATSLSMIDPVSSTLEFAGAALAYGEANVAYRNAKKRKKGDTAKEDGAVDEAREQAVIALMGVGLTIASMAMMTPLPVAGVVLAIGALSLNRQVWERLTDISGLPGPGLIARDTFEHLTSEKFNDAIQYVPGRSEIKTRIESLRGYVTEPFHAGSGAFWRIGRGTSLGATERHILHTQYGFPYSLGAKLAEKA